MIFDIRLLRFKDNLSATVSYCDVIQNQFHWSSVSRQSTVDKIYFLLPPDVQVLVS